MLSKYELKIHAAGVPSSVRTMLFCMSRAPGTQGPKDPEPCPLLRFWPLFMLFQI